MHGELGMMKRSTSERKRQRDEKAYADALDAERAESSDGMAPAVVDFRYERRAGARTDSSRKQKRQQMKEEKLRRRQRGQSKGAFATHTQAVKKPRAVKAGAVGVQKKAKMQSGSAATTARTEKRVSWPDMKPDRKVAGDQLKQNAEEEDVWSEEDAEFLQDQEIDSLLQIAGRVSKRTRQDYETAKHRSTKANVESSEEDSDEEEEVDEDNGVRLSSGESEAEEEEEDDDDDEDEEEEEEEEEGEKPPGPATEQSSSSSDFDDAADDAADDSDDDDSIYEDSENKASPYIENAEDNENVASQDKVPWKAEKVQRQGHVPVAKTRGEKRVSREAQEQSAQLQRQWRALLNRLTERSVSKVASQAESVLRATPSGSSRRRSACDSLADAVVRAVLAGGASASLGVSGPNVLAHAVFITFLAATVDVYVGASAVRVALAKLHALRLTDERMRNAPPEDQDGDEFLEQRVSELYTLVTLLACMYKSQLVHSELLYSTMHDFLRVFQSRDVELLLVLLRACGSRLRSDDPGALKDVILAVQDRVKRVPHITPRMQVTLDFIYSLKNNRDSGPAAQQLLLHVDQERALLDWLQKSALDVMAGGAELPMIRGVYNTVAADQDGQEWAEQMYGGSGHAKGRSAKGADAPVKDSRSKPSGPDAHASTANDSSTGLDLKALAAQQRLSSELRKSLFAAIMGASDVNDVFLRLGKLGATGKDNIKQREAVRVLVLCCIQERTYNPFYAVVLRRLCRAERGAVITTQYVFWDALKQLEEMSTRHIHHHAALLGDLIRGGALDLRSLRALDSALQAAGGTWSARLTGFLRLVFSRALDDDEHDDTENSSSSARESIEQQLRGLLKDPKTQHLAPLLAYFFKTYLGANTQGAALVGTALLPEDGRRWASLALGEEE
ncbi:Nucleolar MIF4G domain-containing protein 1 [Porphyridium purpureum]|uniref:Nucleolar MIF4G domain-containing protein 1 n=1 Tax=Porphyridium purpureum TaxID=35688 RepID=A0A5J4Z3S3_PORPP|nr:Nucleolar MIF4G domain-containing protein 1 [Porphyridium purpureum]|eukprot:POR7324..scf295_1